MADHNVCHCNACLRRHVARLEGIVITAEANAQELQASEGERKAWNGVGSTVLRVLDYLIDTLDDPESERVAH